MLRSVYNYRFTTWVVSSN